jgi:hypothetical protein
MAGKVSPREVLSLLGLLAVGGLGAWFLKELMGQGLVPFFLVLTPLLRRVFAGRVGVYHGGWVLGLATATVWHLGGPYAALGHMALVLVADAFFRKEEEGYGFFYTYFPALVAFYALLEV